MNETELFAELQSIGYPVAYGEFTDSEEHKAPKPPFITYQFAYNNDFHADNQNYMGINYFQVELYTAIKQPEIEKQVQEKLKELRLPYQKSEFRLEEEGLLQIIYEIQLTQ